MIKKNCSKSGKRLVIRKLNMRDDKIITTVVNNYSRGIYALKIDESLNSFKEG